MPNQPPAPSLPPADEIQLAAREVAARPYFELDAPQRSDSLPLLWEIMRWIAKPFFWLFEALSGLPDALRWIIVIGLAAICAALIAHIIYMFVQAIRGVEPGRRRPSSVRDRSVDPAALEREAVAVAEQGDYIGAVRLFFRASLLRIEQAQQKRFQPGFTNRELLRRFRDTSLAAPLRMFVETIDRKWYGNQPCTPTDFHACQQEYARIRAHFREAANAHSA